MDHYYDKDYRFVPSIVGAQIIAVFTEKVARFLDRQT